MDAISPNASLDRRAEGSRRLDRYSKDEAEIFDRRAAGASRPNRYQGPTGAAKIIAVSRMLPMKVKLAAVLIVVVAIAGLGAGGYLFKNDLLANLAASTPLADRLNLDIKVKCSGAKAVFAITNNGNRWLKKADIRFYSVSSQLLLSKRKMVLASGQNATFNVNTKTVGQDGVGLWVKPSWYERGFKYDAAVNCL